MKKIIGSLLLITASLVFALSCKKNDGTNSIPKGCFVKTHSSAATYDTVYYDVLLNIIKFARKRTDGTTLFTFYYSYTDDNKVATLTAVDSLGNVNVRTEYHYNTTQQLDTETNYTFIGNTAYKLSFYVYVYDVNGNLASLSNYGRSGAIFTLKAVTYYTDYDANGNNLKGYYNDSLGNNVDSFYYSFDNMIYPLRFTSDQRRFKNNVLTYREKYPVGPDYSITYNYFYDSKGYPTQRNFSASTGANGSEFYTYICNN